MFEIMFCRKTLKKQAAESDDITSRNLAGSGRDSYWFVIKDSSTLQRIPCWRRIHLHVSGV